MNRGTLVYADNISVGDVADEMLAIGNEPQSESEDESDQQITNDKTVSPKDLYFTTLEINKLLKESTGIVVMLSFVRYMLPFVAFFLFSLSQYS